MAWLSPFGEKVRMKVVATGSTSCKVVVESSSRYILNLLNFGANKENLNELSDYINNEVNKLCSDEELRLRPAEIRMRK